MKTLLEHQRQYPGAFDGKDFILPPLPAFEKAKWAGTQFNPYTSDQVDFLAPGVRDGMSNPSFFAVPAYRTQLWDNRFNLNRPAPMKEEFVDFFTNEVAQRRGQFFWDILADRSTLTVPGWSERGIYSVPPVGFTAFRFLRPYTTMSVNQ